MKTIKANTTITNHNHHHHYRHTSVRVWACVRVMCENTFAHRSIEDVQRFLFGWCIVTSSLIRSCGFFSLSFVLPICSGWRLAHCWLCYLFLHYFPAFRKKKLTQKKKRKLWSVSNANCKIRMHAWECVAHAFVIFFLPQLSSIYRLYYLPSKFFDVCESVGHLLTQCNVAHFAICCFFLLFWPKKKKLRPFLAIVSFFHAVFSTINPVILIRHLVKRHTLANSMKCRDELECHSLLEFSVYHLNVLMFEWFNTQGVLE